MQTLFNLTWYTNYIFEARQMKKTLISSAIVTAMALGAGMASAATTITLLDNTSPTVGFPSDSNGGGDFAAGLEFRVMNNGSASGFGEKDIVNGGETWSFDDTNIMTAVAGTATVPDATMQPPSGLAVGGTGPGLFQNATFFGGDFGFLAPTTSTAAGIANGAGSIINISGDNFDVLFPIMEAHWNGSLFTMGSSTGGVTMNCTGWTSGTGQCTGVHLIDATEDSAGFAGQSLNFDFGVMVEISVEPPEPIPVPAAVWLFGSGLVGLVGVARRKKAAG
jgi:hypothetical protein